MCIYGVGKIAEMCIFVASKNRGNVYNHIKRNL